MKTLSFEKQGHIGILKIERPEAMNALNDLVITELHGFLNQIESQNDLRAIILTGAGDKAFVAGADIKSFESLSPEQARAFAEKGQKVFRHIEILKIPVIAAVNGFALGGGCELALACDFILASEKAKFGLPEVTLGLIPGFGGTQRLARVIGLPRAREWTMSGQMYTSQQAFEAGLVNSVIPHDKLLEEAVKLAQIIASRAPQAVALAKSAMNQGYDVSLDEGMEIERDAFGEVFRTNDCREGVRAFIEKRKANFEGR